MRRRWISRCSARASSMLFDLSTASSLSVKGWKKIRKALVLMQIVRSKCNAIVVMDKMARARHMIEALYNGISYLIVVLDVLLAEHQLFGNLLFESSQWFLFEWRATLGFGTRCD